MAEQSGDEQPKAPKWAWYQVGLGIVYAGAGIVLFVLQGVDQPLWGVEFDFGPLPLVLLMVGTSVVFGPAVSRPLARILAALVEKGG